MTAADSTKIKRPESLPGGYFHGADKRRCVRNKADELKVLKRKCGRAERERTKKKREVEKAKSKMSWKPSQIRQFGKKNPMEALARLEKCQE